jgi:hypothetical protein
LFLMNGQIDHLFFLYFYPVQAMAFRL